MTTRKLLGVNIDHVATIRQARKTLYPAIVDAALLATQAGADSITVHLREDRRHIQVDDVIALKAALTIPLNLEMAVTEAMIEFAIKIQPAYCCLVPESRAELTTEGGLNVLSASNTIQDAVHRLQATGIRVSLFIDPCLEQIHAAKATGAYMIELHTGDYADAIDLETQAHELTRLQQAAFEAQGLGLQVNAGHGLHYHNTAAIAQIPAIHELNIGHAIVARALFVGLSQAVTEMRALL